MCQTSLLSMLSQNRLLQQGQQQMPQFQVRITTLVTFISRVVERSKCSRARKITYVKVNDIMCYVRAAPGGNQVHHPHIARL